MGKIMRNRIDYSSESIEISNNLEDKSTNKVASTYLTNRLYQLCKENSMNIKKLNLINEPDKTLYNVGDSVDISGLKLHVTYSSLVEADITPETSDITFSPMIISENDTKIICSYTYGNTKSVEIPITVKYLSKIEVETQPLKTKYSVGEAFETDGMIIKATYSTGETETIEDYEYSPKGELSLSDDKITISYTDHTVTKTCTVNISVVETTTYGFHVNSAESDPSTAVTYLEDAVGMTPAYMDYSAGTFNYGSWKEAFFIPRPCMLKYDGTVDYYLNPNNYEQKLDGSASDISDDSYGGNAMIEWGNGGKIYYKVVPDSDATSYSVYISNMKGDDSYKEYSFINNVGDNVDYFFTPIYNGYKDSNGRMRSLSGKTPTVSLTRQEEVTACQANNPNGKNMWYSEVYCDITLINFLLILMAKSLDTQTKYGQGRSASSNSSAISTGTMNSKGLFWGSTNGVDGVKVFGMENYWGNIFRAVAGYINASYTQKYKMTYGTQDGSTASAYNFDGSGYKTGVYCSNSSGYISKQTANPDGIFPSALSGSSSTYYADRVSNSSGIYCALRGGGWNRGAYCGVFFWDLYSSASATYSNITAAVSCKPLIENNQ